MRSQPTCNNAMIGRHPDLQGWSAEKDAIVTAAIVARVATEGLRVPPVIPHPPVTWWDRWRLHREASYLIRCANRDVEDVNRQWRSPFRYERFWWFNIRGRMFGDRVDCGWFVLPMFCALVWWLLPSVIAVPLLVTYLGWRVYLWVCPWRV